MKKIYSFLVLVCFSVHIVAATFTFSSDASLQQTVDGITLSIAQGGGSSAPKYYTNGMRLYANNTITLSGTNITNVTITFAKQGTKAYAGLIASTGNLVSGGESTSADDDKMDVWTGSAPTITFTLGATGQRLIKQIVVNGEATTPDNDQPSTPTDTIETPQLDPSYVYAEPTTIIAPNQTVQGAAYDFITNNIAVSSSKGAITQANGTNVLTSYFSAHAGYELTFTATKPIKGIRINGFVKTGFTATVDYGIVTFVSPAEDTEANPVVVVTDINNTSVTLSCVKQLRCYSVEFYFESNPEITTQTVDFIGKEADYEYYADFSTDDLHNYSIYLYGATETDPMVELDIYTSQKENFEGTYTFTDSNLGEYCYYVVSDEEYYQLTQGSVTITKNGDNYTIAGTLIGTNATSYNISYTGELIEYDVQGIGQVTTLDKNAPMYDVLGRRVGEGYKGIVIQNGQKYFLR